ncbi:MAG: hypothetical protein WDN28_32100 [Chthoniobacter sp.]
MNLKFARDKQSLVVRTTEANGVNRDVTAAATFTLADPSKAKIEKGVVYPLADGQTTLKVEYQGQSMEVPVKVEEAKTEQPVSFRLDVMPVFMKAECNRCHGAARGQDGFRLSLWGFDPRGRSLSSHPRAFRPPHQSRHPRGIDAHHQGHRRSAAHRRQVVREGQRARQDHGPLARRGRTQ